MNYLDISQCLLLQTVCLSVHFWQKHLVGSVHGNFDMARSDGF